MYWPIICSCCRKVSKLNVLVFSWKGNGDTRRHLIWQNQMYC